MYFIFCGLGQVAQRTLERGRKYKEYREGSEWLLQNVILLIII